MRPGPFLALTLTVAAAPASAAEFLGAHAWQPGYAGAGGYSALWLEADGLGFALLSDKGTWLRGTLARGASGAVEGVSVSARGPLLRYSGVPVLAGESDAESIAFADGAFFVGFEGRGGRGEGRIARYDALEEQPERLPSAPDFRRMAANRGLEALAADSDGALYAIPEAPLEPGGPFPVFRYQGGAWDQPFALPPDGRHLVVSADVGPDGRLYVLERDLGVLGFRTRLRSMDLTGGSFRVELETGMGRHDNLEGLSVWRDAAGRLRATMISDDNLHPLVQRTEFVDYVLD